MKYLAKSKEQRAKSAEQRTKSRGIVFVLCFALCFGLSAFLFTAIIFAQENTPEVEKKAEQASDPETLQESSQRTDNEEHPSSEDLVREAWAKSSKGDIEALYEVVDRCVKLYHWRAREMHATLENFPERGTEKEYQELNDVATCMFIKAEALMNTGKVEDSKELFQKIVDEFQWAQAWDPRGWYWSVAEKAQASLDMLEGKGQKVMKVDRGQKTNINLHQPGSQRIVNYKKYGSFRNVGTKDYKYVVNDPVGLQKAVGEGIYPNTGAVRKNPVCIEARKQGRLDLSHWDLVHTDDLEAAFCEWATAPEPWGVKLFYLGLLFEKDQKLIEAIKAYRAIIVHFPHSAAKTYWDTPWYPGQAAIAKIKHLLHMHPELKMKLTDAKITIQNGFDNSIGNDVVITWPGSISRKGPIDYVKQFFRKRILPFAQRSYLGKIKRTLGEGKVRLVQYENGHWQLQVNKKPIMIKGITYTPTKVGQSPDKGTLADWMVEDTNNNGKIDGPYDSWVDKNYNNQQDKDEPVVGDFQLLKELGANAIRIYKQPYEPNKEILRKMYKDYGIYVIMGDFLGKYTLGSGADWFEGTDYENEKHKKNMMESVRQMVLEFKDEPYILMWVLGNENNYGVACNADKKPEAYYRFVNEVAQMIKDLDKDHPVALCNGDTLYLDIYAKHCPDVDAYAANAYRGDYGFGSYWQQVFEATGKAAFITEYGCPAYANFLDREEAEQAQADYHHGNWMDIRTNAAGTREGVGNAIGGIVFQWMDEWWKNYEPAFHDKTAGAQGPFPDGYMYEEWFGIIGQGDGSHSPFMRQLRKSYYLYKRLWNE